MNSGAINEIATYLRELDPGKIPTTNIAAVLNLLSKCWPELEGSDRILNHENHETLSRESDNYVVLNFGKIIPETNARTTQGRRNRFIQFLTECNHMAGFVKIKEIIGGF